MGEGGAGVSALGCTIAMVAVGGCAQDIERHFAALVVGLAPNPSLKVVLFAYLAPNSPTKGDLFTHELTGRGLLEFLAVVVVLTAELLLYLG